MNHLYLWPDRPALSLLALWVFSQIFFYAARAPMHRAFGSAGRALGGGLRLLSRLCRGLSQRMAQRDHEMVVDMGRGDAEAKIAREFRRIEGSFTRELARYPDLQRKMSDLIARLEGDYKEAGTASPAAPGWGEAVAALAKMPPAGDRVVQKLLEEIHRSAVDGEKKALKEYREATASRHKVLGSMAPLWKELKHLTTEAGKSVGLSLEATRRIDGYMETFEQIRAHDAKTVRALGWASTQLFVVSLLVLAVAIGGAFVNFNLIALPMSELVPSGSRIGGLPVSTVAALVVVLMEVAAGIFAMEMLGITGFFPKLELLPAGRRRIILVVSVGGLLLLACIESSLAVLREQLVASATALKQSLAGAGANAEVSATASSRIPVIGQAVLGFILPWILAMVAVPLETLISTGGHIALAGGGALMGLGGTIARLLAHAARYLVETLRHAYDIYIVIPLQLERIALGARGGGHVALAPAAGPSEPRRAEGRR